MPTTETKIIKPSDVKNGNKSFALTFQNSLEVYRDIVDGIASNVMTADRMFALMTTIVSRTPDLAMCTKSSLVGAMLNCAKLTPRS
jgi:recombinational DNA repair protein RecT